MSNKSISLYLFYYKRIICNRILCLLALFSLLHLSSAQQSKNSDIFAEQMIQFLKRGFGHADVIMRSAGKWDANNYQTTEYLSTAKFGSIYAEKKSWESSTYVQNIYYFQRIELFQLENGQRIIRYKTNSEKKFDKLKTELISNSVKLTTGEFVFFEDSYFRYKKAFDWQYRFTQNEYDENSSVYELYFYTYDLFTSIESSVMWEKVINSDYDESELSNFTERFKESTYYPIAIQKLEEIYREKLLNTHNIADIDIFLEKFPKTKYKDEMLRMRTELEHQNILSSGDKNKIKARLLLEQSENRRSQLKSEYERLEYEEFIAELNKLNWKHEKIKLIKSKLPNFQKTKYFNEIHLNLEELEFQDLPSEPGVNCEAFQLYQLTYPQSKYLEIVKQKHLSCLKRVMNERIYDSVNVIYQSLLKTTDYNGIIKNGEYLLSLDINKNDSLISQINNYKELYKFTLERRFKVYNLSDVNRFKSYQITNSIKSYILNNQADYMDQSFVAKLRVDIDTFGKIVVKTTGNLTNKMDKDLSKRISQGLKDSVVEVRNYPMMIESIHPINYNSATISFRYTYLQNNSFVVNQNTFNSPFVSLTTNYLNSKKYEFKPGKYTLVVDNINYNGENLKIMSISSYKSFTGVSAVIPAIVIPGLGTRLVTGKKGKAWISWVTYSLVGFGVYYWNQSLLTHQKYKQATNQFDIDRLYTQYEKERSYAISGIIGGGGVYSINLAYVLTKGLGNTFRTLSYNKKYKKIRVKI